MPRCEGLPDEPCPGKVNDRTVRSTQGDLFLCKSCETARFPPSHSSFHASSRTRRAAAGGRGKQPLPGDSSRGEQLPPKQSQSTPGCESEPNAVESGRKAASGMSANRPSDNARSNSNERTGDTVRHDSRPGTQLNPTAQRRSVSCSSDEIELNGNNVCTGCLNTVHSVFFQ